MCCLCDAAMGRKVHEDLIASKWHGSSHRRVSPEHQCGCNEDQHIV